jgi:hypothetical protein
VSVYEAYAAHQKEEAVAMADECRFGDKDKPLPLAPLYFQPTLTEEEQEAVAVAIVGSLPGRAATLRKLLERMK